MNPDKESPPKKILYQPITRIRTSDARAFYRDETKAIFGYVLRRGLRPEKAAEIVQGVWLKFMENGPVDTGASTAADCRAWLHRVAQNEVVNYFRATGRQPEQWPGDPRYEPSARGKDDSATHEIMLRQSELFRSWLDELGQAHPLRCELVFARHIEGASPAELAEKYGKSAHWISVEINRALTDFRAWLVKHPMKNEEL